MASAEATATTRKAEREELHLMGRAVLHSVRAVRLTASAEAMAATATTEAREGRHTVALHTVRAARPTASAEAMATTPKEERKEGHHTDRAVLHTAKVARLTASAEATARVRKAAREDPHIQGNRREDTDSALSREDSPQEEAPGIRDQRSSAARTSLISRRPTRPESTRCFQESRRLTPPSPTTTMFRHLSRKRYVSTNSSPIPGSARAARLTTLSRPV